MELAGEPINERPPPCSRELFAFKTCHFSRVCPPRILRVTTLMNQQKSNPGAPMLRMKLLRLNAGLSQWELSRAAGISQGRYSMIERALICPTPEERTALARALGAAENSLLRPVVNAQPSRAGQAEEVPS